MVKMFRLPFVFRMPNDPWWHFPVNILIVAVIGIGALFGVISVLATLLASIYVSAILLIGIFAGIFTGIG